MSRLVCSLQFLGVISTPGFFFFKRAVMTPATFPHCRGFFGLCATTSLYSRVTKGKIMTFIPTGRFIDKNELVCLYFHILPSKQLTRGILYNKQLMKTGETNTLIIGLVHRCGPMHLKFYTVHFYICLYPLKLDFYIQMNFFQFLM